MSRSVIHREPKILGGAPVFRGTRVPIRAILDTFEAGDSLDDLLDDFPSVTRQLALEALKELEASSNPEFIRVGS